MEPLSATGGHVVPKLHLLSADTGYSNNAAMSGSISERLPNRPPHSQAEPPATTRVNKVMPVRISGASVEFLDTTVLPPMQLRPAATPTPTPEADLTGNSNNRSDAAEFQVLHPAIDELADERGEDLARLLLSRWSIHSGEEQFASISLFCEMKLNEAKRMASWAEAPNRFYTVVCCQLLEKYISRLATSKTPHNNSGPAVATSGQSIAFLRRIHAELIASIFLPPTQAQVQDHATTGGGVSYEHRIPYFSEFKRLRRKTQALVTTVRERESTRATRQQLPTKVSKLVHHLARRRDRQTLALTFRGWAGAMAAQRQIRVLKIQAFQCMRKTNLMAWFRVWHIEALRRAYHRESADYQSMLSVTAASLSRKDIAIAEAEAKVTSMARIIDSLTESNKQLSYRVDQLENLLAATTVAGGGDGGLEHRDNDMESRQGSVERNSSHGRRHDTNYERIDTLLTQDDERMDRTNRMLLETLFGMARMVETCAIQMSKDTMDSLEYQMDGSMLEHLTEMIQTENEIKAKADAAEGSLTALHFGKSAGGRTSTLAAASSSLATAARPARPRAMTIRDLAQMPIDTLLLYWFRMHLSLSSSVEKPGDRTIKNFTSDLADGRRFSFLLHRLFPSWFDASMVHELDVDQRLQNIATFHERVQPSLPQVVTSDSIHAASGTENIAFVAMLFGTAVGTVRKLNMEKQRGDFLNIITTWRRVRGLLLEVKRMNDNYDAGMVAHLLKEMRTCETLFKQLHSELDHITVTTNETSSALSQIAYKILSITWSCVRARDIHPHAPLGLVDERTHERVREFSKIDACCIRDLLVHDTESVFSQLHQPVGAALMRRKSSGTTPVVVTGSAIPPVVPERDVDIATAAVRRALLAYSKDLNDIFKHYSASGGEGSLAAMSLTEFTKFIKDCFTGDKRITPEVAEAIYRAALQLEPPIAMEKPIPAPTAPGVNPEDSTTCETTDEGPELSGRQFSDALVRLAAIKYAPMPAPRATGRGHARAAPTPPLPLDERFRLLMEQDILPHALRSQRELFRAEVAEPKVREVFQRHKPVLQRIFRYYASMHALREQNSTLSLSAFIIMARDCKLVGSFVTEHTLKQVLANLQRDEGNSPAPGSVNTEAELEMMRADFSDFQEALAALTEYVVCNPYVPFHKRIDQFIQEMLLPRARQKKKPGE